MDVTTEGLEKYGYFLVDDTKKVYAKNHIDCAEFVNRFSHPKVIKNYQGEIDLINRIKHTLPYFVASFLITVHPYDCITLTVYIDHIVGEDDQAKLKLNPEISMVIKLKNSAGEDRPIDLGAAENYLLMGLLVTRSMRCQQFDKCCF